MWLDGPQTSQDVGGVGSPLPRYPVTRLPDHTCKAFCKSWGEGIASFSFYHFSSLQLENCRWKKLNLLSLCKLPWRDCAEREEEEFAFSHCVGRNILQNSATASSEPTRCSPCAGKRGCGRRSVCFLLSVVARFRRRLFLF